MAQFSVATNFDDDLLVQIEKLNGQYSSKIVEIYGSLPVGVIGSVRPQFGLPQITRADLERHISLAHDKSLKFNYLMNVSSSINLTNVGYTNKIDEELDFLLAIGIDSLTIADDSLMSYVKKKYPGLELHLSIVKGISTAEEVRRYANLGVTVINLNQHSVNRDFRQIERIVKSVPEVKLRLYANISCLDHCQMRDQHYAYLSKQSQFKGKPVSEPDKYIVQCALHYLSNPIELLRSPFIRPEDIAKYEQLGIRTFKLSDRREPTLDLVNLFCAYLSGEFHGNLFNLLFRNGRKWTNALKIAGILCEPPNICIDNDALGEIDFLNNIQSLNGTKLDNFYNRATKYAVTGLDNPKTISFMAKLRSI